SLPLPPVTATRAMRAPSRVIGRVGPPPCPGPRVANRPGPVRSPRSPWARVAPLRSGGHGGAGPEQRPAPQVGQQPRVTVGGPAAAGQQQVVLDRVGGPDDV